MVSYACRNGRRFGYSTRSHSASRVALAVCVCVKLFAAVSFRPVYDKLQRSRVCIYLSGVIVFSQRNLIRLFHWYVVHFLNSAYAINATCDVVISAPSVSALFYFVSRARAAITDKYSLGTADRLCARLWLRDNGADAAPHTHIQSALMHSQIMNSFSSIVTSQPHQNWAQSGQNINSRPCEWVFRTIHEDHIYGRPDKWLSTQSFKQYGESTRQRKHKNGRFFFSWNFHKTFHY